MEARKLVLSIGLTCVGALLLAAAGANFLHGCNRSHSRPAGMTDVTFDISAANDCIVFSANGQSGRDLYLLSLKSKKVTQLTNSPDYEGIPTFSRNGKSILYTSGIPGDRADHIFLRSLDGKSVRQLTNEDYNDAEPSFSSDGKRIVFTRNLNYNWGGLAASWGKDSVIFSMNLDGTGLKQMSDTKHYALTPAFAEADKT